jgi:hypothetical protein
MCFDEKSGKLEDSYDSGNRESQLHLTYSILLANRSQTLDVTVWKAAILDLFKVVLKDCSATVTI